MVVRSLVLNQASVTHTHEVISELQSVLTALVDAETGQRGFLITGEERYLEPFDSGAQQIHESIGRVTQLTVDNPRQQESIASLNRLVSDKLGELNETIQLRRSDGFEAAQTVVLTDAGKQTADEMRAVIGAMIAEEERLLADRTNATASSSRIVNSVVIGGFAAALVIAAVIAFFLSNAIGGGIRQVSTAMKKIATGDLSPRIDIRSGDEVGQMSVAYGAMQSYLSEMAQAAEKIADGEFTGELRPRSEKDTLGNAFVKMVGNLHRLFRRAEESAARLAAQREELRAANEELRQGNRQLKDARAQAATDGLTGLPNHRAFHERIGEEMSRAQESGRPVGLIIMDIDNFKHVNDSRGHQVGDNVLRELAAVLAAVVGQENAYRYGGDEFAILMPGTDRETILGIAERLRRAVQGQIDSEGISVSLGVASLPDGAATMKDLIYGADAAMYWAKSAGKNRVADWANLAKGHSDGTLPWYAADRAVRSPDVVAALIAALAAKDPITSAHTERCSWYTAKLAAELGLREEATSVVRLASLLHDIGKLAVPDDVLGKPGPLNEEEWAQMKQHPTAALHVLGQIRSIADATPAILHHHEHFDGSGYPDGLAGEDIPVASRILLVTDAFDAMTTDRPYRRAMPIEAAVEELKRNSGTQFDPLIVEAFLRILARDGTQPLRGTAHAAAEPAATTARGRQTGAKTSGR